MTSSNATAMPSLENDFSLVLGGPLYQFFRQTHLCGHVLELLKRRVLVICAIAWLPLLLLCLMEGIAWGNSVKVPFLLDVGVYARLLVALPLLIIAEVVIHNRMRSVVREFRERDLIPNDALPKFDAAIASALRLRNSKVAEIAILLIVYGLGAWLVWHKHVIADLSDWRGSIVNGELRPSKAGFWSIFVSFPILQFLLLRWYYRLFIWARFLWQISRIHLGLIPMHPDRAAGLGFLAEITHALVPLLLAQGVLVAGMIADRIFHAGGKLPQFKMEIAALVIIAVLAVLGPLLVFVPHLARVKRAGRRDYGNFAQRYVREFDHKWIRGGAPSEETPLGSGDIQSLADLGNSFEIIEKMRVIPFTVHTLIQLAIVTLIPLLPLALTMVPLNELLKTLLKVCSNAIPRINQS